MRVAERRRCAETRLHVGRRSCQFPAVQDMRQPRAYAYVTVIVDGRL